MHCIKLLGDKLSARNFDSQVNEIHARIAVINKFTELGRLDYSQYPRHRSSLILKLPQMLLGSFRRDANGA